MCFIKDKGLSERRALRAVHMSASAYRYKPVADKSCELRQKIVALAQHHRRYGAGMIYLKLRQAGEKVNHKRVQRLYAQAGGNSESANERRSRRQIAAPWEDPAQPIRCGPWTLCLIALLKGEASRA